MEMENGGYGRVGGILATREKLTFQKQEIHPKLPISYYCKYTKFLNYAATGSASACEATA